MRKISTVFFIIIISLLAACTPPVVPNLKGCYQSDKAKFGYAVFISFQPDDSSFVEYIDNREVDKGTYGEVKNNVYKLKSDKQNFQITLNTDNAFEIIIKKINNGKPIQLKNVSAIPGGFLTKFNDVGKYKALLD